MYACFKKYMRDLGLQVNAVSHSIPKVTLMIISGVESTLICNPHQASSLKLVWAISITLLGNWRGWKVCFMYGVPRNSQGRIAVLDPCYFHRSRQLEWLMLIIFKPVSPTLVGSSGVVDHTNLQLPCIWCKACRVVQMYMYIHTSHGLA